jgi:hypothetical protein
MKFFLAFSISISSCDHEIGQNVYYWDQTKCSDPWNTGENDSEAKTATALRTYFDSLDIHVLEVNFENISEEGKVSCDACPCLSGIRILISIPNNDHQKGIDVGFKKVN